MSKITALSITTLLLILTACETGSVYETGPVRGQPTSDAPARVTGAPAAIVPCDSLVPITANDTGRGIALENQWIEQHYPGARKVGQALTNCGRKKVDVITIITKEGNQQDVYFDITSFFGKVGGENLDDLLDG
ncbi:MAG: hypothetical protein ACWA5L_11440 [bacterium]